MRMQKSLTEMATSSLWVYVASCAWPAEESQCPCTLMEDSPKSRARCVTISFRVRLYWHRASAFCRLELPSYILNRERVHVEQCLDGQGDLCALRRDDAQILGDSLLFLGCVAEDGELAYQQLHL